MSSKDQNPIYLLFMLFLSVYAVLALALVTLFPVSDPVKAVVEYGDTAVCILFLLDFIVTLIKAKNKWHYFYTWGWLDLISSLPMIDLLRWGRAARIVRIIRVLRGIRATKILSTFILKQRAESTFLAVCLISILLVIVSSVAMLQFENSSEANIRTAEDAVWWAIATVTTVGYGDRFPVSTEGRVVASLLMTAGVGLFGTFSGFIASWFLRPPSSQEQTTNEEILRELEELKAIIKAKQ